VNEGHGFSRAVEYAIGEGFTGCGKTPVISESTLWSDVFLIVLTVFVRF
jgi:hypothetical protein